MIMGELLAFVVFVSLVVAFVWFSKRPDRNKRSALGTNEQIVSKTMGSEYCMAKPRRFLGYLIGAWIALGLHSLAIWDMLAGPSSQRGRALMDLFAPSSKHQIAAFFGLIGYNFLALAALALGLLAWYLSKGKRGKVTVAISVIAVIIASALC